MEACELPEQLVGGGRLAELHTVCPEGAQVGDASAAPTAAPATNVARGLRGRRDGEQSGVERRAAQRAPERAAELVAQRQVRQVRVGERAQSSSRVAALLVDVHAVHLHPRVVRVTRIVQVALIHLEFYANSEL